MNTISFLSSRKNDTKFLHKNHILYKEKSTIYLQTVDDLQKQPIE